jgi:predicted Holliday junction resolvase-like endonuclease
MDMASVLFLVIGVLFTLVQAFFWNTINRLQKKVDELEREVINQKSNYTDKFEEVKELIIKKYDDTKEHLNKLELKMTEHISYSEGKQDAGKEL